MSIIRLLRDSVPADRFNQGTLLLTLPAAVVPLVPFAYGYSPAHAVFETARIIWQDSLDLWATLLCGLGSFTGWIVLAARFRLQVRKRFSPRVRSSVLIAAIASAALTLSITGIFSHEEPGSLLDIAAIMSAPTFIGAGLVLLMLRRRRQASVDRDALLALEMAFLAHAVLGLLLFPDFHTIGWWLTLVVTVGLLGDLAAAVSPRTDLLAPSVPDVFHST